MELGLAGKHVLIAGGTRGIGLACAGTFLAEGAVVTIVGRQPAGLQAALDALQRPGAKLHGRCADLRQAGDAAGLIDAAWSETGPIDVLVNAAGAARRTPFGELTPQVWLDAINAKFMAYVNVFDPVVKRMAERGTGSIVNIVGMGGKVPTTTHLGGGSANAALMLASAGLASAYASRGIRVNVVNPALTLTDRLKEGLEAEARLQGISMEEAGARAVARFPMGRLASPQDVADAVAFLASERAAYISGISLSIDGAATPLVV